MEQTRCKPTKKRPSIRTVLQETFRKQQTWCNQMHTCAVLYDGRCGLCQQSIRLIRRLDRRHMVSYWDVQDRAMVLERFPALASRDLLGQIHVVAPDGSVRVGYDGMREIARVLPLPIRWITPILGLPLIAPLGRHVYRWIAAHRYQFNRFFGVTIDCTGEVCSYH